MSAAPKDQRHPSAIASESDDSRYLLYGRIAEQIEAARRSGRPPDVRPWWPHTRTWRTRSANSSPPCRSWRRSSQKPNAMSSSGRRGDDRVARRAGRLPHPPRDRPGRDGGRLRGGADFARPPRGPEGAAVCRDVGPTPVAAVPQRGPGGRRPEPSQHCRHPLGRLRARRPLLRDGVHRGADAGPGDRGTASAVRSSERPADEVA